MKADSAVCQMFDEGMECESVFQFWEEGLRTGTHLCYT